MGLQALPQQKQIKKTGGLRPPLLPKPIPQLLQQRQYSTLAAASTTISARTETTMTTPTANPERLTATTITKVAETTRTTPIALSSQLPLQQKEEKQQKKTQLYPFLSKTHIPTSEKDTRKTGITSSQSEDERQPQKRKTKRKNKNLSCPTPLTPQKIQRKHR